MLAIIYRIVNTVPRLTFGIHLIIMRMRAAETILHVEQPLGDPIEVNPEVRPVYDRAVAMVGGEGQVEEHFLAAAAVATEGSEGGAETVASIAKGWSDAERVIAQGPVVPIIYGFGRSIALADPSRPTLRFEGDDKMVIPVLKGYRRYGHTPSPDFGEDEPIAMDEGTVDAYRPLKILASGTPDEVDAFHGPRQKDGGNDLIVGVDAVDAYLNARAAEEMSGEMRWWGDRIAFTTVSEGFSYSQLLYDVATLKELGYDVSLAEEAQKAMHKAGVEVVAGVVVAGLTEGSRGTLGSGEADRILRRLPAADISMRDAQEVAMQAAELVGASREEPSNAFVRHAKREGGDMEAYLQETTANFMRRVLKLDD